MNMKKITSCDAGIFSRVFGGTFTGVLSGLCQAMEFKEAWKKAVECCEGIEDIASPQSSDTVGEYISRSGKKYVLGSEHPKNLAVLFSVEFPAETGLDVEACFKTESALIGHSHCVTLV